MKYLSKYSSRLIILPIRFYQITVSPFLPSSCPYHPSCSSYCLEAVKIHGVLYGLYLGVKRLCRCHPWHLGGYDPVPLQKFGNCPEHKTHHHSY